jgi:Zn-dependent membrane protease YugP
MFTGVIGRLFSSASHVVSFGRQIKVQSTFKKYSLYLRAAETWSRWAPAAAQSGYWSVPVEMIAGH